ncbi:fungal-specific transcription factor domain-containing protein [Russula emetica]|nr:fungal-specific transcription factor domain-containing protein [Russula emetica]
MASEDFFASIMNADNQHPRDPSRPKRQSRMSREIVSSNNSMLVTPSLEWQDRLSNSYAWTDEPETLTSSSSPPFHVDGQPSFQRRRLDQESTPPNWGPPYKLEPVSESDDSDDATSLLGELSLDENKEVRYHGAISGLHLLSHADRTDERKIGGVWQLPMARVWPPAVNQFIPEENVDVSMPPLDVQRHLLDLYFIYVHPVFPVIHKSLFWKDYEATYSDSSSRERPHISNLLLLSMFATAARYDQTELPPLDPGNLWEAGLDYMVQAREVLNRVYHYCRGTTCQALLLLGLREFGIGKAVLNLRSLINRLPPRDGISHGMLAGIRVLEFAQDLGLHRDATLWQMNGKGMFTLQELQARKQIWWACIRADKYTAVYMGRPPTISESHFDTPPPDDEVDDLWALHRSDPAAIDFKPVPNCTMAAYRRVATLCVITGNVINRIYPVHPPSQSVKRAALAELGAKLDHWYAELPDSLAFDPASSRSIPPPNVLMMHATYWNTVLLLHRAFIPKWRPTHSRHASNGTRESETLKSFDICQSAAAHITSIFVAYQKQFGLSRAALLCSILRTSMTMRPSNVQTSVVLQQTLTCLKDMGIIWPSAYRAWGLVGGAKVHVDSGFLHPKPTQRQKRPADDAFGVNDRSGQTFNFGASAGTDEATPRASAAESRLLAHMLGIDFSSTEPSAPYPSGYEWWSRDQNKPRTPDSSSHTVSPSPRSGSSHSSPAAAMPIPFSFEQTHNFWDAPLLQDMGVNYVTGA